MLPLQGTTGEASLDAGRWLRQVERLEVPRRLPPLPAVEAPSLEGLSVTVPAPEDITQEQLLIRFKELVREHAAVRERQQDERLHMGDEVLLDVLGYAGGRLIPFSARSGLTLDLVPQALLPGLCEALAGHAAGDTVDVELTLPEDYPVPSLRGQRAIFLVDVLSARELTLPDADSDAFLHALGRGQTHEEVMDSLREELEEELAQALRAEARERVLDAVFERAGPPPIPAALVDEEVRRQWERAEAPVLRDKGFDAQELREALDGWLQDGATRAQAERRLGLGLVLGAIAGRDGVALTDERLEAVLEDVAAQLEVSADTLRAGLHGGDPQASERIRDVAWHLIAVEHVLRQARVHFEGAEEEDGAEP